MSGFKYLRRTKGAYPSLSSEDVIACVRLRESPKPGCPFGGSLGMVGSVGKCFLTISLLAFFALSWSDFWMSFACRLPELGCHTQPGARAKKERKSRLTHSSTLMRLFETVPILDAVILIQLAILYVKMGTQVKNVRTWNTFLFRQRNNISDNLALTIGGVWGSSQSLTEKHSCLNVHTVFTRWRLAIARTGVKFTHAVKHPCRFGVFGRWMRNILLLNGGATRKRSKSWSLCVLKSESEGLSVRVYQVCKFFKSNKLNGALRQTASQSLEPLKLSQGPDTCWCYLWSKFTFATIPPRQS